MENSVQWHVDKLKIFHVEKKVVECLIDKLNMTFRNEVTLATIRSKVLEYFGMTKEKIKVKLSMHEHIEKMLDKFPSDMQGTSKHLQLATCSWLMRKLSYFLKHMAKILYICRCMHQDIQTAEAFLCIRAKIPDVDVYKKLTTAMQYIRVTKKLT